MLEQPVHILHLGARAGGDPPPPRPVDQVRLAPLLVGHRIDDGDLPSHLRIAHRCRHGATGELGWELIHQRIEPPHALQLLELALEVVEVETPPADHLTRQPLGLGRINLALHLLDERHDIAHAEDAPGHALRVEGLQGVEFLADADEDNGLAGYLPNRQGRATAGVAVGLGQYDTGQIERSTEGLGGIQCVLTGHSVDDEQPLMRANGPIDGADFVHQFGIHVQPARRIDNQHVEHAKASRLECTLRDRHRVTRRIGGMECCPHLLGESLQLQNRRRAAHVSADEEHALFTAIDEPAGEFSGGRGLAGTLQTGQQHHEGWLGTQLEALARTTHELDKLAVQDRYEHLTRRETGRHLGALRLELDRIDEALDDRQGHVGLKQGHPDLAEGLGDVVLANASLALQTLDGFGESLTQVFEHRMIITVSDPSLPLLFTLLGVCMLFSAFFSGTETALMSINRYQLRTLANKGHRGAQLAEKLLARPDRLIGLILLGNNLANNLAATLVAIIVLRTVGEDWVAVGAGVLTLVMLIFCEVGPKTYGALNPRPLALLSSYAYTALQWLMRPFVFVISWITNGALRLVGLNVDRHTQQTTLSREELRTVVAESGLMIPRSHQQMLMGILDLERVTVNDIMIPRQDIAGIDLDEDWERILEQLRQTPHTRLPVYRGDIGQMIGLVHMRRIAQELARGDFDRERLEEVARQREPYYVPDSTPLTVQLANFQRERRRFGFVVDEYGDVLGLVTLEDILEEIVGEFTNDPATVSRRDVHREASGSVIVNAGATVRALNRTMNWSLPTDGPKTLNGVLLERLETMPTAGTALQLGSLQIEILQMGENTIRTVRVRDAAPR